MAAPPVNIGIDTVSPTVAVGVGRSEAPANFRLTSFTDASNQAPQYIQRHSRGTEIAPQTNVSGDLCTSPQFMYMTGKSS